MAPVKLDHTLVAYFLKLAPEVDAVLFEAFLSGQVPEQGLATYSFARSLSADRTYIWTASIGSQFGGSDRQGKPLVLDGVVNLIEALRQQFSVTILQTSWSPSLTEGALIAEFNKLTGPLGKFHVSTVTV